MGAAAPRTGRSTGWRADLPAWPVGSAALAVLGALVASLVGAALSTVVLAAAGAEQQTGAGTLIIWAVTAAGTLWVIHRVAGRTAPPSPEQLGLRLIPATVAARVLVPGAVAVAALVALGSLLVDLASVLAVPDQITGARTVDRLLRPEERGAIEPDAGVLAGIVGLGVLAPWTVELLLRGFVLPALSAWRGPLVAGVLVSVLGAATSWGGGVAGGELLVCVLGLQAVLCLLYLGTGSVLPGIVLSAFVTALALGAGLSWSAPAVFAVAAGCAAAGFALGVGAARGLHRLG